MRKQFNMAEEIFGVWHSQDLNVYDVNRNYKLKEDRVLDVVNNNLELLRAKGMYIDVDADYETEIGNTKIDINYIPGRLATVQFIVRLHNTFDVYVEADEGVREDVTYKEFENMIDYKDLFYPDFL